MSKLEHSITYINSLRPSIAHYFLMSIEDFVEKKQLEGYLEMPTLYKFKNLNELKTLINGLGQIVSTPMGDYLKTNELLALINVSANDLIGLYINFEIIYKDYKDAKEFEQQLAVLLKGHECNDVITRIAWYYQSGRGLDSFNFYDVNTTDVHDEAYPYLGTSLEQYTSDFIESTSSVLMLLGPPGTGKTRFIKYVMKYMAKKYKTLETINRDIDDDIPSLVEDNAFPVMYSTSQDAYDDDYFFIEFIRGRARLLILEDIDFNLKSREDGNVFMHKLLSTSDGIIELKNKKIIISTNLQSKQKTDKALVRPGRMYGILETQALSFDQAQILADKLGTPFTIRKKENMYTLAEIYNNKIDKQERAGL